jgi:hypothetical protein
MRSRVAAPGWTRTSYPRLRSRRVSPSPMTIPPPQGSPDLQNRLCPPPSCRTLRSGGHKPITQRARAIGVTWVHSSTGVKIPIASIADGVARANRGRAAADRCLLIVDGVHGFGNQHVDVAQTGCDFFACGAHKWLFAPRDTGFLWRRTDAWPELRPTIPTFDPDVPRPWTAWNRGVNS